MPNYPIFEVNQGANTILRGGMYDTNTKVIDPSGGTDPRSWEQNLQADQPLNVIYQTKTGQSYDTVLPSQIAIISTQTQVTGKAPSEVAENVIEMGTSGKVTTITYKPNKLAIADAQPYTLTIKNNSGRDWVFYTYQTLPEQKPSMLSLAWFASPYPIAPNDEIEFQWFINYNFVWSDTGELKPGINYKTRGPRDASLETLNSTTFGYNSAGAPTLSQPILDSSKKGTLVINDLGNIPDLKFSVGIGMSGQGTFVEQAGPNLQHFFTPTPVYWVGAATERKVGDVLDIKTVTQTTPVKFQQGIYAVTMTLNASNQWQAEYIG
jgi:rhizosphere induced protein